MSVKACTSDMILKKWKETSIYENLWYDNASLQFNKLKVTNFTVLIFSTIDKTKRQTYKHYIKMDERVSSLALLPLS